MYICVRVFVLLTDFRSTELDSGHASTELDSGHASTELDSGQWHASTELDSGHASYFCIASTSLPHVVLVISSWKRATGAYCSWSLFCKERRERFALGHQNGKKCQKHCEKYKFIRVNRSLFDSVRANHSHRSFLKSN